MVLSQDEYIAKGPPEGARGQFLKSLWEVDHQLPEEWFQVSEDLSSPFELDEAFALFMFSYWFKGQATQLATVALQNDDDLRRLTREDILESSKIGILGS